MKLSKLFPSTYLRAGDLDAPVRDTITKVRKEDVGGEESKPVVYFKTQKPLVLNVTNGNSIKELAGTDETDDWPGVEIELYPAETEFKGKRVPCVRIRGPQTTRQSDPFSPEYKDDVPHTADQVGF